MKRLLTLNKYSFVCLDSNIFSYHFHQHPVFGLTAKSIFDKMSLDNLQAVTSLITLTEILSIKAPLVKLKELEKLFKETPNLTIVEFGYAIATQTARIRRKYKFKIPDAIQLATALQAKTQAFITNDEQLKKFKEIKVLLLSELK